MDDRRFQLLQVMPDVELHATWGQNVHLLYRCLRTMVVNFEQTDEYRRQVCVSSNAAWTMSRIVSEIADERRRIWAKSYLERRMNAIDLLLRLGSVPGYVTTSCGDCLL